MNQRTDCPAMPAHSTCSTAHDTGLILSRFAQVWAPQAIFANGCRTGANNGIDIKDRGGEHSP